MWGIQCTDFVGEGQVESSTPLHLVLYLPQDPFPSAISPAVHEIGSTLAVISCALVSGRKINIAHYATIPHFYLVHAASCNEHSISRVQQS